MFKGEIQKFFPDRGYGFIELGPRSTIYFNERDVRPDWKGSTAWCRVVGAPVTFNKKQHMSRKYSEQTLIAADDVTSAFAESQTEPLETYRELSRVNTWNGCFGNLIREDGCELFFHRSMVLHKDRLPGLQIGDFLFHGLSQREDGRWRASDIELYSSEEQARLHEGLPPYEVEVDPITSDETPGILSAANRKKTLLELVQEKRV